MNKLRPIKLVLSLTLIIFSMFINTVKVSAEQFELTAKLPDSVNIGNSFDIMFSTEVNTNVKAIRIKVNYNSDYISFEDIDNIQPSEVKFNSANNTIDFIILFDSTLKSGDVFKLEFAAKSGNKSSKQKHPASDSVISYLVPASAVPKTYDPGGLNSLQDISPAQNTDQQTLAIPSLLQQPVYHHGSAPSTRREICYSSPKTHPPCDSSSLPHQPSPLLHRSQSHSASYQSQSQRPQESYPSAGQARSFLNQSIIIWLFS